MSHKRVISKEDSNAQDILHPQGISPSYSANLRLFLPSVLGKKVVEKGMGP
jgi:hypothetical protein